MTWRRVGEMVAIFAFLFVLVWLGIYELERFIFLDNNITNRVHVWSQFITGNWPSLADTKIERASLEFSALTAAKIFMVVVPISSLVGLFWRLATTERRVAMSIIEYLADRDRFITTEVYREFRDKLKDGITHDQCRDMARAAIRRAAQEWRAATDENIERELGDTDISTPQ